MKKWITVLAHFAIWVLFILAAVTFGASYLGFEYFLQKVLAFIGLAVALFYFNYSYLIPNVFQKKHYVRYVLISLVVITLTSSVRYLIEEMVLSVNDPIDLEPNKLLVFLRYYISCIIVFVYALLFRMILNWREQEKKLYEWSALKNETDLKFLKNQLRPHFLFNSINNIYSIAVENEDTSAPLLLEISQMLRYLIYKTDQKLIPLKEEVYFLNSLIKLYSLRFDATPLKEISVSGHLPTYEIPPLTLLPFIENVFKHGDFAQPEKEWRLHLYLQNGVLTFETINPIKIEEDDSEAKSGIGLSNLMQRLDLLYPDSYTLRTVTADGTYKAHLEIKLDEK